MAKGSGKKPGTPVRKGAQGTAKSPSRTMTSRLTEYFRASLLPADNPLTPEQLRNAVNFLAGAAMQREEGKPTIAIETADNGHRFMRVAIVNDDMPFLVDSVSSTFASHGLLIDRLVHPVVPVRRDTSGAIQAIEQEAGNGGAQESMIYLESTRVDAASRRSLEQALAAMLGDVRAAVTDWSKMKLAMAEDADRVADAEGAALLRWLNDEMLTQLGHMRRTRDGGHTQLLGICRKGARSILADATFDKAFAWFDERQNRQKAPLIVKANRISNVHRRVPIDLFIVPEIKGGKVAALSVHAGIWTSAALNTPPDRVPRLREHLARLIETFGVDRRGHTGKTLAHALTALPHDLIIAFSDEDIARVASVMTSIVDQPRPRLTLVAAPLKRHLFVFVWLPRDMLSTQSRLRIQDLLEDETGAVLLDWTLQVERGALATLRFVLDIRESSDEPDEAALDRKLQALLRGWEEAIETALATYIEPARAAALALRLGGAFPEGYRAEYGAGEAALDLLRLHRLDTVETEGDRTQLARRDVRFFRLADDAPNELRLKVYEKGGELPLSDAVPALENFGFRVMAEVPTKLTGAWVGTIHDFTLALPSEQDASPLLDRAPDIEAAIAQVINGAAENDIFNRLVIGAGLQAQEAGWLRAIFRYLRQASIGFTVDTAVGALERAAPLTRALIAMLRQQHDPDFTGDRKAAAIAARDTVRENLANVAAINDDRLLRLFCSAIDAILRTNAFSDRADVALAFKFDSSRVPGLPRPVPWREIFVYSRRVEGVHLRAGPVARGGLRWSDRRDDFRTEILGLMKAQRVKNAVIVPTGAKGGFYPKRLPDPARDRDGWAAEGQACYEIFIRSLLSVTDNIVDGEVTHPARVVVHDDDDPYFVVAADKGTARFSDVANAIAQARDFWLDDAFASGGSKGYDHKAMGITARGAWLSVRRHFLEMGVDVQTQSVRIAGCGDMSGDVFGNGMLLSRAIKLVAAFDHRHIFIDPDPDPEKSWQERQRLYDLPRSSWADYDGKLISKGGGVFPRTLKRIELSSEARAALGIEAEALDPDALISAILTAPIDLLWFGGIGTYVKASAENHIDVGDPGNDGLRVDARDLRAKAVGEGANLGVTQAARIEYAIGGGRINTDFIDNSAGVDCSDNEVNIKIALAAARKAGKLSEARRIALLETMTDDVAALVLEDNRLQALALSVAEQGGEKATASHLRLMEILEGHGSLDRKTEGLADSETFTRRAAEGKGFTRPELAVLLSSAKLVLQDAIEQSRVPDDPMHEQTLLAAFPSAMRGPFATFIKSHRLRREIIATKLANTLVNRLGIVHPFELAEQEGADLASIVQVFCVARALFGLDAIWDRLESAEMPEAARLFLLDRMSDAVTSHMADLLRIGAARREGSDAVRHLESGLAVLARDAEELAGDAEVRRQSAQLLEKFVAKGAPAEEAEPVVRLFTLDAAAGLADVAETAKTVPREVARAFSALGEGLGLDWAQTAAASLNPSGTWERLLVSGLARDFQHMRVDFLRELLKGKAARQDLPAAVENWLADNEASVRQFRAMIDRARASVPAAPAMLAQIAGQARNLLS